MERFSQNWWNGKDQNTFFPSVYKCGDNSQEGHLENQLLSLGERTLRECDLVESYLELKHGSSIIDCPCGYGRHSQELANRGYDVTGVDLCPQFLKDAKKRVQTLHPDAKCTFIEGDMRKLPEDLKNFNACINMFFSFGFFDEASNLNVLSEFYRILKNEGKLLIHTDVNPDRLIAGKYGDRLKRTLQDGSILQINEAFDFNSKRLNGAWTIHQKNGRIIEKNYSVRIYSHNELINMLKKVGFKKISIMSPDKRIDLVPPQEVCYAARK